MAEAQNPLLNLMLQNSSSNTKYVCIGYHEKILVSFKTFCKTASEY